MGQGRRSDDGRTGVAWRVARRSLLVVALLVCAGSAVLAIIWQRMAPLPLARAEAVSVTVLDRNDRLLRAYTTPDGRWRLPADAKDVDARYLAMLIAFEDKRFRAHHGVDPWAVGRAGWQLVRHGRIVSGGPGATRPGAS